MALVFSFDSEFGTTFASAYLRVTGADISHYADDDGEDVYTLSGTCLIYADAAARNGGMSHVSGDHVKLELDMGANATHHNPIKQLYLALKAGKYSGSTDA